MTRLFAPAENEVQHKVVVLKTGDKTQFVQPGSELTVIFTMGGVSKERNGLYRFASYTWRHDGKITDNGQMTWEKADEQLQQFVNIMKMEVA